MGRYDQNIKKKVAGHESDWNGEQFWNDLAPQLPKKKKRRVFWLWLLLPLAFIAISGLYYINQTLIKIVTQSPSIPIAKHVEAGKNEVSKEMTSLNENTNERINREVSKNLQFESNPSETFKSSSNTPNDISQKEPNSLNHEGSSLKTSLGNSSDLEVLNESSASVLKSKVMNDQPVEESTREHRSNLNFDYLMYKDLENLIVATVDLENYMKNESSLLNEFIKSRRFNHRLAILGGASFYNNIFSSSSDEGDKWLASRADNEKSILATNFGMKYTLMLNDHWGISLGADYRKYTDKLNADLTEVSTQPTTGTRTISTANGDTTFTVTDYQTTTTSTSIRNGNSRAYVSVPLGVLFEKPFGSWRFQLEGGAVLHKLLSASGKSINDEGDLVSWSSSDEVNYSNDLWYSLFAGIGIEKRLTTRYSVFVNPRWEWSNANLLVGNSSVNQKVTQIGINAGLSVQI